MEANDASTVQKSGPFVDDCIIAVRDFGGGDREVMVCKGFHRVYNSGEPTWAERLPEYSTQRPAQEPVADPGRFDEAFDVEAYWDWKEQRRRRDEKNAENRARAARKARQTVMHRVKVIKADRLLTLTYRENMTDRRRLQRDWQAFVRRIRRVQGFEYVATQERQKRGAWHIHVAIKGRQNYRLLRSIWRSVVGENNGNIDVRNPFRERALRHKLAAYMSKYVGKGFDEQETKGARRVWCSEGIQTPVREVTGFRWVDWPTAVQRAAEILGSEHPIVGWYQPGREILVLNASTRC